MAGGLALVAVALAGCGGSAQKPGAAASSTTTASSTEGTTPLLVVADPSPYAGGQVPTIVRFIGLDGHEVSHAALPTNAQIVSVAGARVFVLTPNGALSAIHRDGSTEQLANLGTSTSLLASPDGTRWVWVTETSTPDGTVTSSINLGGDGVTPRVIETATENNRSLRPYEWTAQGLFVEHGISGIGGYILYYSATGPVDRLDVDKNSRTLIAGSDKCYFSDMSADGTVACFPATKAVRLEYADGKVADIPLSIPRFNATGDAYFSRDGSQLTVSGATMAGATQAGSEQYGTDLIKVSDASISRLSLDGVRPADFMRAACWLADGSVVVYRPEYSADGTGVYLYHPDGKSTLITKTGMPVGIVTG